MKIDYLEDRLIVRNAFEENGEGYDIVVEYPKIQRLETCSPEDLAERIYGIWQQAQALLRNRDVTAKFTWDKNQMSVQGKQIAVKQGNNPMKQLHELVVGRFYQGISVPAAPAPMKASAQPTKATPTPVASSVSTGVLPEPELASPKPEFSEPVIPDDAQDIPISPKPKQKPKPKAVPQKWGPSIDLTDDVAEAAFETVLERNRWHKRGFFDSLVEPLKALKRDRIDKNNKALQFLTEFAREIGMTHPNDGISLAVSYFCCHAKTVVSEAGLNDGELLIFLDQYLNQ